MRISVVLDTAEAVAGYPLEGSVFLDLEPTDMFSEIYVQFTGASLTELPSHTPDGRPAIVQGRRLLTHTRVVLYKSYDESCPAHATPGASFPAAPPEFAIGRNEIRFKIDVPVFTLADPASDRLLRDLDWAIWSTRQPRWLRNNNPTMPLPPSVPRAAGFQIEYSVVAVATRPGKFKSNKMASKKIKLIPAHITFNFVRDFIFQVPTTMVKKRTASAKCAKLPDSYFVPGALTRATGIRMLIPLANAMYVGVPVQTELIFCNTGEIVLDVPFGINLFVAVDVDSLSRIRGILDIELTSVKVVLKSSIESMVASGQTMQRSDKLTILEHKVVPRQKLVPLLDHDDVSGSSQPRYHIDVPGLDSLVVSSEDAIPSFSIVAMRHTHIFKVRVGLAFNGGSEKAFDVQMDVTVNSNNDFDLDSHSAMPPAYGVLSGTTSMFSHQIEIPA
ncbi:uncharacterized protein V1518DRAFT_422289 [Limtongia smithiae]|uniref:uncharacterized protein n=1 Tax=Limtongia smithiae TaxID=1125753 RepID=UPI0034CFDEF2